MKKLALLLIPMLVIIAIVFSIREKEITYLQFLDFIDRLRFSNAIESIKSATKNLSSAAQYFGNISTAKTLLGVMLNLARGIGNALVGGFYLIKSALDVVIDVSNNLFKVTDFLFGTA